MIRKCFTWNKTRYSLCVGTGSFALPVIEGKNGYSMDSLLSWSVFGFAPVNRQTPLSLPTPRMEDQQSPFPVIYIMRMAYKSNS